MKFFKNPIVIGAGVGTVGGLLAEHFSDRDSKPINYGKAAGGGATVGGILGYGVHGFQQLYDLLFEGKNFDNFEQAWQFLLKKLREEQYRQYQQAGGQSRKAGSWKKDTYKTYKDILNDLDIDASNINSQQDFKRHVRKLYMKYHPDKGGDVEKMKEINKAVDEIKKTQWFKNLNKTSSLRKLAEAYKSKANWKKEKKKRTFNDLIWKFPLDVGGAAMGAYIGHKLGKVKGSVLGGAIGSLTGEVASMFPEYKKLREHEKETDNKIRTNVDDYLVRQAIRRGTPLLGAVGSQKLRSKLDYDKRALSIAPSLAGVLAAPELEYRYSRRNKIEKGD